METIGKTGCQTCEVNCGPLSVNMSVTIKVRSPWSQTTGFKNRSTVSGGDGDLLSGVKRAALENLSTRCVHTFYSCFTKDKVTTQGGSRNPYIIHDVPPFSACFLPIFLISKTEGNSNLDIKPRLLTEHVPFNFLYKY